MFPLAAALLMLAGCGNSGTEVPDVIGESETRARAFIEGEGFEARIVEPGKAVASHPIVNRQIPAGGSEAPDDAVVTLEVGPDYGAMFGGG